MPRHFMRVSKKVAAILSGVSRKHNVPIELPEVLAILTLSFKGHDSLAARTLYTQEMLARGILASGTFYASYAHTDAHIARFEKAVDEVFALIAEARKEGGVERYLKGPVAHAGFQRLN